MQSIYSEFRKNAAATPDAMAVEDGSRALTYAQLDALADTIAAGFPSRHPAFVGIVMDHSVEMVASILAVLKTGAAYVPAEPSFPMTPNGKVDRKSLPVVLKEGALYA